MILWLLGFAHGVIIAFLVRALRTRHTQVFDRDGAVVEPPLALRRVPPPSPPPRVLPPSAQTPRVAPDGDPCWEYVNGIRIHVRDGSQFD